MKNLEWVPVLYNGIETNVEVTKCGRVRRVKKEWIIKINCFKFGEVDFSKLKLSYNGYKILSIKTKDLKIKTVFLHQLIASAFLGYKWQGLKNVVDHIDSNKLNNHLDNLRVVTNRENSSKETTFKSGLPTGVYFLKKINKFESRIYFNKKSIYLGSYNTPEEASQAYQNKLKTISY